jgi:DHA2 family multidrug resistance protein-like MFS transporter
MPHRNDPRRWWVLGFLAVPLLAIGLDGAILNVAQPTLAADLHASITQLQWFANAYTLVLAAGMLPAGLLGDRFGQKRLLVAAVTLFTLASVACAYSTSPAMLIIARAFLGIAAAFIFPLSFSILSLVFPSDERRKALSIWATTTAAGIPLGPVLGGWLLEHYWWGSAFLINVPLLAVAAIMLSLLIPPAPGSTEVHIDLTGIALSSLGLTALTYGMIDAGRHGLGSGVAPTAMVLGLALLVAFVLWSRRAKDPLVDLGLFRSSDFAWGSALGTLASFGLIGALFMLPLYFQAVDDTSPLDTGLRLLPIIAGMIVAVPVAERTHARYGPRSVIPLGFALMTVGLVIGTTTRVDSGSGLTAGWLTILGLGLGFTLPMSLNLALGSLPVARSGVGSALVQVLRQFGSTVGVGILGTVLNLTYRTRVDVSGLSTDEAQTVRRSATAGVDQARDLGLPQLQASVREAFVHAMHNTLWVAAATMLVGTGLASVFLRNRVRQPDPAATLNVVDV